MQGHGTKAGDIQWDAIGRPCTVILNVTHASSIVAVHDTVHGCPRCWLLFLQQVRRGAFE